MKVEEFRDRPRPPMDLVARCAQQPAGERPQQQRSAAQLAIGSAGQIGPLGSVAAATPGEQPVFPGKELQRQRLVLRRSIFLDREVIAVGRLQRARERRRTLRFVTWRAIQTGQ